MKKIYKIIASLVLFGLLPLQALAVNITVPSAPAAGYYLVSTSTGQYLASSTPFIANLIFGNATGTNATTTNFFSTTASSTNLFSALATFGNLLTTGSSTLQNFTFRNATGTAATTTNFFSTTASSTNVFSTSGNIGTLLSSLITAGTFTGGTFNGTTGTFNSLTSGRVPFASTGGLLVDSSAFTFDTSLSRLTVTNLISTNSTSTNATSTTFYSDKASTTDFRTNTSTIGTLTVGSCTGCSSGGGSISTIIPFPNFPSPTNTQNQYNVNTTAFLGQVSIPYAITVNKISFQVSSFASSGTIKVALFSEDGQTQKFSVTSGTISGTGIQSIAVSSVALTPGIYYIVALPTGTTDINIASYSNSWGQSVGQLSDGTVSSEPILNGSYTVSAGTMPSSITLASIVGRTNSTGPIVFRLDN